MPKWNKWQEGRRVDRENGDAGFIGDSIVFPGSSAVAAASLLESPVYRPQFKRSADLA